MLCFIGAFFGLAIARLIFYVITVVVAPPGIWIFPKRFAGVVRVASHIRRLTRHCCRSNRSFYCGSGMFQRKKGAKKGTTPAGKEKRASNGGAYIKEVESESPDSSRPGSRAARWRRYRTWIRQVCLRQRFCTFCEGYVLSLIIMA